MSIKLKYKINAGGKFQSEVERIVGQVIFKVRPHRGHRLLITDDPEYGEREAKRGIKDPTRQIVLISEEPVLIEGHLTLTTFDKLRDTIVTLNDHQLL